MANLPMIVPKRMDTKTYGNNYDAAWLPVKDAARLFNAIGSSGGINWSWYYFISEGDAIAFELWCNRNAHETRGVYPPWERGPWSVRYR